MPSPRLTAALCALLMGACASTDQNGEDVVGGGAGASEPVAYAAFSRERARGLKERLRAILEETLPSIREAREELRAAVDALQPPVVLASRERRLREWHGDEVAAYREQVSGLYGQADAAIDALVLDARTRAVSDAQAIATPRSPLDEGPSGDALLDRELVNFEEAMTDAINLNEMDAQRQLDLLRRVELVEHFNSFGEQGADAALGGRLTLFIGGEELADEAIVRVVLRPDEGVGLQSRRLFQAVRYRIMRGQTQVQDLGWRPMPAGDGWGLGETHDERYVVWAGVQPGLLRDAAGFEQLKDMRIVADLQTAVVGGSEDSPRVLGGIDWRLEFRVTFRGDVAWQPAAAASTAWNPACEEVRRLLGVTDAVSDART